MQLRGNAVNVHCRIGAQSCHARRFQPKRSLPRRRSENHQWTLALCRFHCRITIESVTSCCMASDRFTAAGSSENHSAAGPGPSIHCRMTAQKKVRTATTVMVVPPRRRLRKTLRAGRPSNCRTLPHKKLKMSMIKANSCSLPHRQLRKRSPLDNSTAALHCRMGSSEIIVAKLRSRLRSLPHRQLKKVGMSAARAVHCRRQLKIFRASVRKSSLPDRQLRKTSATVRRRELVHCRTGSSKSDNVKTSGPHRR